MQVFDLLHSQDLGNKYPLFTTIFKICYEGAPIDSIIDGLYIPNGMNGAKPIEEEEDGGRDDSEEENKESA
jgi:hypothetical protein